MTNFINAVKMLYNRYTDFKGRSSRSQYWWVQLLLLLIVMLCAIFVYPWIVTKNIERPPPSFFIVGIGAVIFVLGSFLPLLALQVRRFHDLNLTGWLYLVVIVLSRIPILGLFVSIGMLIMFCVRGTDGPNKYGADPLNVVE